MLNVKLIVTITGNTSLRFIEKQKFFIFGTIKDASLYSPSGALIGRDVLCFSVK
jgi:hypothetical protein